MWIFAAIGNRSQFLSVFWNQKKRMMRRNWKFFQITAYLFLYHPLCWFTKQKMESECMSELPSVSLSSGLKFVPNKSQVLLFLVGYWLRLDDMQHIPIIGEVFVFWDRWLSQYFRIWRFSFVIFTVIHCIPIFQNLGLLFDFWNLCKLCSILEAYRESIWILDFD